jgi:hypothetical protein
MPDLPLPKLCRKHSAVDLQTDILPPIGDTRSAVGRPLNPVATNCGLALFSSVRMDRGRKEIDPLPGLTRAQFDFPTILLTFPMMMNE